MAPSATELLDMAEGKSLGGIFLQAIGSTIFAAAVATVTGILSLGQLLTSPINALATAIGELITAILTSPIPILKAGVLETVRSITGMYSLGPLAFAESVAAVLAGVFVLSWFIARDFTTNTGLLGTGIDINYDVIPFVESAEEEDD